MPSKPVLLVSYKLSASNLQLIRSVSDDAKVLYAEDPSEIEKLLPQATVLFGDLKSKHFPAAKYLKWVHLAFAGVDRILYPEFVESDIVLTSSKGLHRHQMTELLFGMMLCFTRSLSAYNKLQQSKKWDVSPYRESNLLNGKTIGILGMGMIGSEIAKVAKAFGMRVIGLRKNPSAHAEHVDLLLGMDELPRLLAESDHIVVVLPLTAETRNLITKREFDSMERKAYFYNLARGAIVNEADLVEALRHGKIKGAGLDVFAEEPLDVSSPLWEMENVMITPHVGGLVPHYMRGAVELFLENLRRYLNGEEMLNVVDKRRGY